MASEAIDQVKTQFPDSFGLGEELGRSAGKVYQDHSPAEIFTVSQSAAYFHIEPSAQTINFDTLAETVLTGQANDSRGQPEPLDQREAASHFGVLAGYFKTLCSQEEQP